MCLPDLWGDVAGEQEGWVCLRVCVCVCVCEREREVGRWYTYRCLNL